LIVFGIGQLAEGFLVIEVSGKNDSGTPLIRRTNLYVRVILRDFNILCWDGVKLDLWKCLIKGWLLWERNLPAQVLAIDLQMSFIEERVACES